MKQLILAAGKGTRLKKEITNKCLTVIEGKTLLDYNLELTASLNITGIIVVVGHNAQCIIDYLGESYQGIPIDYVYQHQQLGIAHAVNLSRALLKESFLMCLSDELLVNSKLLDMKHFFIDSNADCVCGIVEDTVENIRKAYTVKLDNNYRICDLIEKPFHTFNQFKGTGYCMMRPSMLPILDQLSPNPIRREYEMGNWIQNAILQGLHCYGVIAGSRDFNINTPEDIIEAEHYLRGEFYV